MEQLVRNRTRRLSLHLATWATLACLGASLAFVQFNSKSAFYREDGWPLTFGSQFDVALSAGSLPIDESSYRFTWPALELNIGMWLLLFTATTIVVEGWLRRPRPWQFQLGDLIGLVFTAAVMAGEYYGALNMYRLAQQLNISPNRNFWAAPWWVQTPIYISLGCLIFVTGRAIVWSGKQVLIGARIVDPPSLQKLP